jgi:hypothetical protein
MRRRGAPFRPRPALLRRAVVADDGRVIREADIGLGA